MLKPESILYSFISVKFEEQVVIIKIFENQQTNSYRNSQFKQLSLKDNPEAKKLIVK